MKKVVKKEAPQPVIMTQIGLMNCLPKIERGTRKGETPTTKKD
jgi:hypothetical protein